MRFRVDVRVDVDPLEYFASVHSRLYLTIELGGIQDTKKIRY